MHTCRYVASLRCTERWLSMPTARALQAQSFRVILIVVPCVFVLQLMCLIPVGAIMISVVFALAPDAHILLSWQAKEVGNRTSWTSSKLEAGSLVRNGVRIGRLLATSTRHLVLFGISLASVPGFRSPVAKNRFQSFRILWA